jgi:hypothetical protein
MGRSGPAETSVDMCTYSRPFGFAVPVEFDDEIRAAAFLYIDRQRAAHGDRIPWKVLQTFEFNGQRRALITQRGIRWISGMPALTFTTTYRPPTPPKHRMAMDSARTDSLATSTKGPNPAGRTASP